MPDTTVSPQDLLDRRFMQRALDLACLGLGQVSPNPMVGAVVVHRNRIIGEGWHRVFGGPHAEVEAIGAVSDKSLLTESTIYVTLEPCSHFGKTPPCADLILKSGIKKVVVAMTDPNPLVSGRGLEKLRSGGLEVVCGVLEAQAKQLNKRFLFNIAQKKPYVILKWAQTADGFLAPSLEAEKSQKRISNTLSQQLVHKWRAEEDSIMVGMNTLRYDNPQLNIRHWQHARLPARITFDEREVVAGEYYFFDGTQASIVFNYQHEMHGNATRYFRINESEQSLQHLLERLYAEGIGSLIVEGGTSLLAKFLTAGTWSEARIGTSPKIFGAGVKAPVLPLPVEEEIRLQDDCWKLILNRNYPTGSAK